MIARCARETYLVRVSTPSIGKEHGVIVPAEVNDAELIETESAMVKIYGWVSSAKLLLRLLNSP